MSEKIVPGPLQECGPATRAISEYQYEKDL